MDVGVNGIVSCFFFDILFDMLSECVQEAAALSPLCRAVGSVVVVDDECALWWLNVISEFGEKLHFRWLNRIP